MNGNLKSKEKGKLIKEHIISKTFRLKRVALSSRPSAEFCLKLPEKKAVKLENKDKLLFFTDSFQQKDLSSTECFCQWIFFVKLPNLGLHDYLSNNKMFSSNGPTYRLIGNKSTLYCNWCHSFKISSKSAWIYKKTIQYSVFKTFEPEPYTAQVQGGSCPPSKAKNIPKSTENCTIFIYLFAVKYVLRPPPWILGYVRPCEPPTNVAVQTYFRITLKTSMILCKILMCCKLVN